MLKQWYQLLLEQNTPPPRLQMKHNCTTRFYTQYINKTIPTPKINV